MASILPFKLRPVDIDGHYLRKLESNVEDVLDLRVFFQHIYVEMLFVLLDPPVRLLEDIWIKQLEIVHELLSLLNLNHPPIFTEDLDFG